MFPDGVRWQRLNMGPVLREFNERRLGSAADAIERADNRATIVFAMGVMLGSKLVVISIIAGVGFVIIAALGSIFGVHFDLPAVFTVIFVLVLVPFLIAKAYDQRGTRQPRIQRILMRIFTFVHLPHLAERMRERWVSTRRPDSPAKRGILLRVFSASWNIGIGRNSYAWMLLTSQIGEFRTLLVIWFIFVPVTIIGGINVFVLRSSEWIGNYALFPHIANGSNAINAAYYDDQRNVVRSEATPYIQSAVVTDPFIKLVVPYQPNRDAAAMKRLCASALRMDDAHARAQNTLDCLGTLHAVTLDGVPARNLRYDVGSDIRNGQPALVAMIDVRALAAGRHELIVQRAPSARNRDGDEAITQYVIPFWR